MLAGDFPKPDFESSGTFQEAAALSAELMKAPRPAEKKVPRERMEHVLALTWICASLYAFMRYLKTMCPSNWGPDGFASPAG